MERFVKVADVEVATEGIGRDLGRALAEEVEPGDTLDFSDVRIQSNSFADEFIKRFVDKYGLEGFMGIKMVNVPPLLAVLFRKSLKRYIRERNGTPGYQGF